MFPYTLIHCNALLSEENKSLLINWAREISKE